MKYKNTGLSLWLIPKQIWGQRIRFWTNCLEKKRQGSYIVPHRQKAFSERKSACTSYQLYLIDAYEITRFRAPCDCHT